MSKVSNSKGSISQAGDIWPRFDAESPQSPSFPRKEISGHIRQVYYRAPLVLKLDQDSVRVNEQM